MAFNINAQVMLSGPKNIKAVTNKIQKQLGGITATVNLKVAKGTSRSVAALNKHLATLNNNLSTLQGAATGANSALASLGANLKTVNTGGANFAKTQNKVNNSLKQTSAQVQQATDNMADFGKESARAIRRFGAFTIATGTVFGFIRAVQTATKEALTFERELVKLEQITGKGGKSLDGVRKSVDDLSKSLGIDANQLLKVGKIFAQTGQSLDQVEKSLKAVARASLAPTFGTMESTTEGLIATMAQFNIKAQDAEKVLGSLNAVSKKFAVESSDLISAIRRAGGVFAATANQMKDPIDSLNELIAIFTSVRSTTRETADTIATGLRTIFSRIQRPRTIQFLKEFGIELVDMKGNFKGTFEAFQELSKGLDSVIKRGDTLTLARITEELGGIRQVGKLIPAIKNFDKSLRALEVASKGAAEGLGKDVAAALQPLGKQFEQVSAQFSNLIRDMTRSDTFQNFARTALQTASALISVADALRPLIPLIATFASVKIARGAFGFGRGFVSEFRGGGGAAGVGGALGGAVTAQGSQQQIAAQARTAKALSSLNRAISTNSQRLNSNTSGLQRLITSNSNLFTQMSNLSRSLGTMSATISRASGTGIVGGGFAGPQGSRGRRPRRRARGGVIQRFAMGGTVADQFTSPSLRRRVYRKPDVKKLQSGDMFNPKDRFNSDVDPKIYPSRIPSRFQRAGQQLTPRQFEEYVAIKNNSIVTGGNKPLDIVRKDGLGIEVRRRKGRTSPHFVRDKTLRAVEQNQIQGIKNTFTARIDKNLKLPTVQLAQSNADRTIVVGDNQARRIGLRRKARRYESGGSVFEPRGTDTVPAMLTPGEFVINRRSAERIGYDNLADMNRLAKGGVARSSKTQYFATGSSRSAQLSRFPASMQAQTVAPTKQMTNFGDALERGTAGLVGLGFVLSTMDFSTFENSLISLASAASVVAATFPTQIGGMFETLTKSGGKLGGVMTALKSAPVLNLLKGVGIGAIATMIAEPIASAIVNKSLGGTMEERVRRRVGTANSLTAASDAGLIAGGVSGGITGAGIGAAIGTAIAPGIGTAIGAVIGGAAGAFQEAMDQSGLEMALQNEANVLARTAKAGEKLEKVFIDIARKGSEIDLEDVLQARSALSQLQIGRSERIDARVKATRAKEINAQWFGSTSGDPGVATKLRIRPGKWKDESFESLRRRQRNEDERARKVREARQAQAMGAELLMASPEARDTQLNLLRQTSQRRIMNLSPEDMAQVAAGGFGQNVPFLRQPDPIRPLTLSEQMFAVDQQTTERDFLQRMGMTNLPDVVPQSTAPAGDPTARLNQSMTELRGQAMKEAIIQQMGIESRRLKDAGLTDEFDKLSLVANSVSENITNFTGGIDGVVAAASRAGPAAEAAAQAVLAQHNETVKLDAATKMMADAAARSAQEVQSFAVAFDIFTAKVSDSINKLNTSTTLAEGRVGDLTKTFIEMRETPFVNPFENVLGMTHKEIDKQFEIIEKFAPDQFDVGQKGFSEAFKGGRELLKAQKETPEILKDVIREVAADTSNVFVDQNVQTRSAKLAESVRTKLQDPAAGGLNLPDQVVDNFIENLTVSFSRQQGSKLGPRQIFLEGGEDLLNKSIKDFAQPLVDGASKAKEAINTFANTTVKVGNMFLRLSRQQIEVRLKQNRNLFGVEDRTDSLLGKTPTFDKAERRLQTQLAAILGNRFQQLGTGVGLRHGFVGAGSSNRVDQLTTQRESLETRKKEIEALQDQEKATHAQQRELTRVTDALNKNKQATELLANDMSVLAELERKGADFRRKEQAAQSGILGFSEAVAKLRTGTPEGIQAFEDFVTPMRALVKASRGQILRPDEGRILVRAIESGDTRIAALMESLPGGPDQATAIKQSLVKSLARDTVQKLLATGGAPGTFAQLVPLFEKSYSKALEGKQSVAAQMRDVVTEQNRMLESTMGTVTQFATDELQGIMGNLQQSIDRLAIEINALDFRRQGGNPVGALGGNVANDILDPTEPALPLIRGIWDRLKEVFNPPGRAGGGPVRSSSIKTPGNKGTDTKLAMLTPGEFVVTAGGTRGNETALQHANRGGKIIMAARGGMALPGQMMGMQQRAFGQLGASMSNAFGGLYGAYSAASSFNPYAFNPASMFALTGGYNTPFGTVGGPQFQNPGYTYNLASGGPVYLRNGSKFRKRQRWGSQIMAEIPPGPSRRATMGSTKIRSRRQNLKTLGPITLQQHEKGFYGPTGPGGPKTEADSPNPFANRGRGGPPFKFKEGNLRPQGGPPFKFQTRQSALEEAQKHDDRWKKRRVRGDSPQRDGEDDIAFLNRIAAARGERRRDPKTGKFYEGPAPEYQRAPELGGPWFGLAQEIPEYDKTLRALADNFRRDPVGTMQQIRERWPMLSNDPRFKEDLLQQIQGDRYVAPKQSAMGQRADALAAERQRKDEAFAEMRDRTIKESAGPQMRRGPVDIARATESYSGLNLQTGERFGGRGRQVRRSRAGSGSTAYGRGIGSGAEGKKNLALLTGRDPVSNVHDITNVRGEVVGTGVGGERTKGSWQAGGARIARRQTGRRGGPGSVGTASTSANREYLRRKSRAKRDKDRRTVVGHSYKAYAQAKAEAKRAGKTIGSYRDWKKKRGGGAPQSADTIKRNEQIAANREKSKSRAAERRKKTAQAQIDRLEAKGKAIPDKLRAIAEGRSSKPAPKPMVDITADVAAMDEVDRIRAKHHQEQKEYSQRGIQDSKSDERDRQWSDAYGKPVAIPPPLDMEPHPTIPGEFVRRDRPPLTQEEERVKQSANEDQTKKWQRQWDDAYGNTPPSLNPTQPGGGLWGDLGQGGPSQEAPRGYQPRKSSYKDPFAGDTYVRDQMAAAQGGGGGAEAAAKLAESTVGMNKLADAINNMPTTLSVELKQEGRVIIALDNKFTPMMKDYFESWYQERLNGEGGPRADGQITDPSMINQANNVT